jgi:hypothetical protein
MSAVGSGGDKSGQHRGSRQRNRPGAGALVEQSPHASLRLEVSAGWTGDTTAREVNP